MVPELTVLASGDAPPRRFVVKAVTTIGRAESCDVRIDDEAVSADHAEIRRRDGRCFVADLGSEWGTFLNGSRLEVEHALADGDVISLGKNQLVFRQGSGDDAPVAPIASGWFSDADGTRGKAIAVANLKRENHALGVLTHATSALSAPEPLHDLLEKILDLTFAALPAERGAIIFLESDPPQPVVKAT